MSREGECIESSLENTWLKGEDGNDRADGRYDGFEALKNRKFIVDDESGQIMSSIIRSFLLGSQYIFRQKQLLDAHQTHLSAWTDHVLSRARAQHQSSPYSSVASSPRSSKLHLVPPQSPTTDRDEPMFSPVSDRSFDTIGRRRHVVQHDWATIRAALHIAKHEHMSSVDDFKGHEIRHSNDIKPKQTKDTKAATFLVDKDRKDEMTSLGDDLAIVCPLVDGRLKDVAER